MLIRKPGLPTSWPASPNILSNRSTNCCRGIGGRQLIPKGPQLDSERSTRGLVGSFKGRHHGHISAVYRRGVEAEILADNPPHTVQLPNRYPRQMAWKPLSVRPALSIRSAGDPGRRIRRTVHSLGLD